METITAAGVVGAAYVAPWEMNGKAGISRYVLVYPSFVINDNRVGPLKLKFSEQDVAKFEQVVEAGPGAALECTYALHESFGKVNREVLSVDSLTPAGSARRSRQLAA